MALSAGQEGTTTNRTLNKLQYAMANIADDITAIASGDKVLFIDVSDGYKIKYGDADDVLQLTQAAATSRAPVSLTATGAITKAAHEGRPLLMGASGAALTFTLPAATGSGDRYLFIVSVVNTSNYLIKASAGTMLFTGMIIGQSATDSATDAARTWVAGASDDSLLLNGTTRGGVNKGDCIEFIDCSATQWFVRGRITQSGSEATPFENTVA